MRAMRSGGSAQSYRAVMLTRRGGPDVLQTVELPMVEPGPGELRVRVTAAGVGATDVLMLAGTYVFAPKMPFVPGYEIAGTVDALGAGVTGFTVGQRVAALTLYGGYGEFLVRAAEHFVPVPDDVSDVDAAAVILNYVSAWQMIHRVAHVAAGDRVLVTAAAGGVGTALLQLLQVARATVYGAASAAKHEIVSRFGGIPIDYRAGPIDDLVHAREPSGVDCVFDAVGGRNIGACTRAARRGGRVVGFGFLAAPNLPSMLAMFVELYAGSRLRGRTGSFYGITLEYRRKPHLFHEDLPKIFALVGRGAISPLIAATFPLLNARKAVELLASGSVAGKIVLTNPATGDR